MPDTRYKKRIKTYLGYLEMGKMLRFYIIIFIKKNQLLNFSFEELIHKRNYNISNKIRSLSQISKRHTSLLRQNYLAHNCYLFLHN